MLIYKIVNTKNGKVYIGQTTKTLAQRKSEYKSEMANRKSNPRLIIRAMRKYGFENFKFSVIEGNIESIEELNEREKMYIRLYKATDKKYGYNIELGGNSVGKHSAETKQKISEAQLGSKNHMYGKEGYLNKTSKEVIDLTTGERYGSASLAGKILNISFSHICSCCRGERGSTGGRVFRYIEDGAIIIPEKHTKIKSKDVFRSILPDFIKFV